MRVRQALLAALLLVALARPNSAAAAGKAENADYDLFIGMLPCARLVCTATVAEAKVEEIETAKTLPGQTPWIEVLTFERGTVLYGAATAQDELTVRVTATPPRAPAAPPPAFKKGDKLLVLAISLPNWNTSAAIQWSEDTEKLTRETLAPGWWRGDSFSCPWCQARNAAGKGTCQSCKKPTAAGDARLCSTCAAREGACPRCDRKLAPATPKVALQLRTLSPKLREIDPLRIAVAPASAPELWVCVDSKADSVPELPCRRNQLGTCETLFFLVDDAGHKSRSIAFFERTPPASDVLLRPQPLTGSTFVNLKPTPAAVFEQKGTYTVRAVAGRLVSNPVTVDVRDLGAVGQPGPDGADWQPGSNSVACSRDGKVLWKVQLQFPVGQVTEQGRVWLITSNDGSTTAAVDPQTGKMLEIRKNAPEK